MRIGLFTCPGRFPTAVHDAGAWLDALAAAGHSLHADHLNARWWREVAGPAGDAMRAGFVDAAAYRSAAAALDRRVAVAGRRDFALDLGDGPVLHGVDLHDSRSIAAAAVRPSALGDEIAALLLTVPPLDLALLRATSPAEVATAAIVATRLHAARPGLHICLAEHSYENFSLRHHLDAVEAGGAWAELFDTIIAEQDDTAALLPWLADRLAAGDPPRGVLRNRVVGATPPPRAAPVTAAMLVDPLFAPEPVVHLRLSPAACYWSRCTFCTQNSKYAGPPTARKADVDAALNRVAAFVAAGCRTIIFTDEAISPAMLGALADAILARGLRFRWAARCKLERSYGEDLLARAAAAGCRELLFGLESIAPGVLAAMDKLVPGQDAEEVAAILARVADAGIGLHINLINGFPGESVDEAWQTARFVADTLAPLANATFGLNPFTVFPATPIAAAPARFGIAALDGGGDMPASYDHRLAPRTRRRTAPAVAAFHELQEYLQTRLGWADFLAEPGGETAFTLYMATGHGVLFKAGGDNPIDAIRQRGLRPPAIPRRRRAFLTGATGVVGGAALAELRGQGWHVTTLLRDPFAGAALGDQGVLGDLFDLPPLDDILAGADAIIHCASPRSLDPAVMARGEVEATARLLADWSSGSFVYCSSQTVHGVSDAVLDGQGAVAPETAYDHAKLACEALLAETAAAMDAPAAALRLPLVLSARVEPGRGNWLIELAEAMDRNVPFAFASDEALACDGSVWIGDADAGRALIAAAVAGCTGPFTLASGFVTWRDLLTGLGAALGLTPRLHVGRPVAEAFAMPRSITRYRTDRFDRATGFAPGDTLDRILHDFAQAWRHDRYATDPARTRLCAAPD